MAFVLRLVLALLRKVEHRWLTSMLLHDSPNALALLMFPDFLVRHDSHLRMWTADFGGLVHNAVDGLNGYEVGV
jgi:hypothetical protein